jgi:glycosyltransferase involved in cell wall biosynthesis
MKIAMIGHKRIPSREGGIEIVVEELSTRMFQQGIQVTAYNRAGHHISGKNFDGAFNKPLKEYKGVRIITVPTIERKGIAALIYSVFATFYSLFGHYDCIHFHGEGPCAMIWLPHLFGIRIVATIHGLDWQRAKWGGIATKFLKFGEKMAAKYADEVIVLSANMQLYFLDTYNRKTQFIPNGISKPEIKDEHLIRDKWGLEKDGYILFLGRIVPEKGLHYLIDAFGDVDTLKKLVIAGGSSDTSEYMAEIKVKAKQDGQIIFTDFVKGEALEELYSNAYIYVLPSDLEGMPISLLEGMSYGNCCMVSDIPECTEVVEDKAVTFKKSDVADLREKLGWLCENPEVVNEYRTEVRDFICNKYDWEGVVEKTIKLYKKNKGAGKL